MPEPTVYCRRFTESHARTRARDDHTVRTWMINRACRALLVGLATLALPHIGNAQTDATGIITGVVLDGTTKDPLAAALVKLGEVHRNEPAHERGEVRFSGLRPGPYTVIAERIEYHTQTQQNTESAS